MIDFMIVLWLLYGCFMIVLWFIYACFMIAGWWWWWRWWWWWWWSVIVIVTVMICWRNVFESAHIGNLAEVKIQRLTAKLWLSWTAGCESTLSKAYDGLHVRVMHFSTQDAQARWEQDVNRRWPLNINTRGWPPTVQTDPSSSICTTLATMSSGIKSGEIYVIKFWVSD